MSASRNNSNFGPLFRYLKIFVLSGLGLVALGFLYYFLATLGPRRVGGPGAVAALDDPAIARLSAEISVLEKNYRQAADVNLVTSESTEALVKAVGKQRELLRTFARAGQDQSTRLARLESELASVHAREKVRLVDQLEKDGEELLRNGKVDEAGQKFREGLRLQREVNASSAGSRFKNYVRETALTQAVAAVEAAPLHGEMETAQAAARQAAAEQRWADALKFYTAARDAQTRINREFARTRYADLAGVDRLNAEIESLNAAGVASEIDAKEKAGDEAVAQRLSPAAAALFGEAETLQLQVNRNYPRSRFVSSQRIEDLAVKRQTALSAGLADSLAELDRVISRHLNKRQIVAADQKLVEAVRLVERLFNEFPKSRRLDGSLRIKFAYLALRKNDLRALQDEVYDRILPLPGSDDRFLFKTEVSQSLYVLVMNTNPSRNAGRAMPVDSVSWNDAQEFCMRLSWLLGASVRLPTPDEFRLALGNFGAGESWNSSNSEGRSHEVGRQKPNGAGFSDLLGNLAEWCAADPAADKAQVMGGSYLEDPAALLKGSNEFLLKNDRARHVGLRVVVEF